MDLLRRRQAVRGVLRSSLRGRGRDLVLFAFWSAVEALPALLSGRFVAWAADRGFLHRHVAIGLGYLALFALSVLVGTWGTRQAYLRLAAIVEPFRDALVRLAVTGALRRSTIAGRAPDTAAVARLTQQVEIVREAYASVLMVTQGFLIVTASALIGLFTLLPAALLLVVPPLLIGVALFLGALGRMARLRRMSIVADEHIAQRASTMAGGLRDVVACGGERTVEASLGEHIVRQASLMTRLARFTAMRTLVVALGGWLPIVLILVGGSWLRRHGATTGAILGALTYVLQGLHPALQTFVRGLGTSGLWLLVTLRRIVETSEAPEPVQPVRRVGRVEAEHSRSGVCLSAVSFAYGSGADPVIDRLDLAISHGDHLAIVGPSGIGKSTLANLISGILDPQHGEVRINELNVRDIDPGSLARQRVLIPQETYLFAGTVRENLLYLCEDADDAQLDDAVERIGAQGLVSRLGGYDAPLQSSELSAGERQLVTLVRAYLSPAPLIILDEATCYLDPIAEARAEEAFVARPGTLIVIAHRMSSAMRARRILVLDGARAVLGSHAELLSTSPLYRDLVGHWDAAAPNGAIGHWPQTRVRRRLRRVRGFIEEILVGVSS